MSIGIRRYSALDDIISTDLITNDRVANKLSIICFKLLTKLSISAFAEVTRLLPRAHTRCLRTLSSVFASSLTHLEPIFPRARILSFFSSL